MRCRELCASRQKERERGREGGSGTTSYRSLRVWHEEDGETAHGWAKIDDKSSPRSKYDAHTRLVIFVSEGLFFSSCET